MDKLREWLENKQADLVTALEAAIAEQPDARPLTHAHVSALVLALSVATTQEAAMLGNLVKQWNDDRTTSAPAGSKWTATLMAVREQLWANVISEFSPANALACLRELDRLLVELIARAAELDQHNREPDPKQPGNETYHQLRRLEQSKSDFISIAAHELKTPLTLIEGYANMLMMEIPEDVRAKTDILLGGIANGTERLREIIEGMIDVSMIDTQVLDISFQPVSLRQITSVVVRELATVLRIRQLDIGVEGFPEDGALTYGDPTRLHQAFSHVLGNAIKYTPDGGHIRIRNTFIEPAESQDGLRGYLDIAVSDTGIGIASENLERIFDKFAGLGSVALHSTSKYKFKGGGPGLGLTIARGFIEAHGGKIWAESEGCDEETCPGSTFHIYMPLWDAPPYRP